MILAAFAAIVGVFTDRQVTSVFYEQLDKSVAQLASEVRPTVSHHRVSCDYDLTHYAQADGAQIRVFDSNGDVVCSSATGKGGRSLNEPLLFLPSSRASVQDGFQIEARSVAFHPHGTGTIIYARRLSSVDDTLAKVRGFLVLGVLGGTVFALLAGLATAQRAIRPIRQLTDAAREIERTRDPSLHVPQPEADDEVAELARTLEGMLGALGAARAETEGALARQREFVADASHELRTPLTSVLANLELLADELQGESAESAKAALRSTRRMRRLVGDLLLLARADAERHQPYRPTDLAEVLTDAAAELEPVADEHELTIEPIPVVVQARRDDLHRLVLNLVENAIRHTPPGTRVHARSGLDAAGRPELVVEDDGPGIPPELQRRVFERFVRGGGDTGSARGTGLGLAIVRAVADSHGASVALSSRSDGAGTRFVITWSAVPDGRDGSSEDGPAQTSTTTGSTIGRRRNRS